jgi:uncharacterized flavoprotein (TIGR03862 family)
VLWKQQNLSDKMTKKIIVVGAGPAGLMAAEVLSKAGLTVAVFDAMPSVGRKFLLAGKGGLNLTHAEAPGAFVSRYGERRAQMAAIFQTLDADDVRAWAASLGIETFVGSSGRVFPLDMKAAPLLRAWLHRLRHPATAPSVQFHMRHRWQGWADPLDAVMPSAAAPIQLDFATPAGPQRAQADAVLLALGGGSWARLGSDGAWVPWLRDRGVAVSQLVPSNCGFDVQNGWSQHFASRFAGLPFKSVAIEFTNAQGKHFSRRGEFVATATGVEGSLIYAASSQLRDAINQHGQATFYIDLLPDLSAQRVSTEVSHPRGSRSLSSHLKSRLNIDGIKVGMLYELLSKSDMSDVTRLAAAIKALPVTLTAARPLDEAISSAGGVQFEAMTPQLMLQALPGVFCAGEMLDWEAPTGGYLLTACLASGAHAAQGVLQYLNKIMP